jgi:hypothetical protein
MSVGAQMIVVLKAFVEHCVLLVLGHPFEFAWLEVSQTDVFHRFLLVSSDSLFADSEPMLIALLALPQSRKHSEWPTRSVEVNLARPFKGIHT